MVEYVFYLAVLLFGAVIGSFLNVVIYRYNTGLSALRGRSMCFSCGKKLAWYELIPIVSFLIQEGACRSCGSPIARQYVAVESVTAFLFLLSALVMLPFAPNAIDIIRLVLVWGIVSLLMVIAVYDMRHKIIPDGIVYAFIGTSFVFAFTDSVLTGAGIPDIFRLLGGPVLFLPFALLWFFSRGAWMGFGDAKLAWGIGWLLGLRAGISAVVLGFWAGALAGIFLLLREKFALKIKGTKGVLDAPGFGMKSEIPFAPFLILGTLTVLFTGIDLFPSLTPTLFELP